MNRRDLLLQQMNIAQWTLTKPQALKGNAQIRLSAQVKLVVICAEDQHQSGLFQDILRTLQLQDHEYQWFDLEQAMRLSFEHNPHFWLIQPEEQAVRFRQKFATLPYWHHSSWQAVRLPANKRQFWQQIEPLCSHFEDNT